MGYQSIPNLYKDQRILEFKEVYALEKVHGTTAHVSWSDGQQHLSPGGTDTEEFRDAFNQDRLREAFEELGHPSLTVYGEAYGGSCQGMEEVYGGNLKFIAFDVRMGDCWLSVEDAERVVESLGLSFVPYTRVSSELDVLDEKRDAQSIVAARCGGSEKNTPREGIVLRPPFEVNLQDGTRLIAKYKNRQFQERNDQPHPEDVDPEKMEKMRNAREIAREWVTEMRLTHVLDEFDSPTIEDTGEVISAMTEDIFEEGSDELDIEGIEGEVRREIGNRTAELFHRRLEQKLKEDQS